MSKNRSALIHERRAGLALAQGRRGDGLGPDQTRGPLLEHIHIQGRVEEKGPSIHYTVHAQTGLTFKALDVSFSLKS